MNVIYYAQQDYEPSYAFITYLYEIERLFNSNYAELQEARMGELQETD